MKIMAKQIDWAADTVDSKGNVWPTVGENIRNGAKNIETNEEMLLNLLDLLYPIDAYYIGILPEFMYKHQTWAPYPGNAANAGLFLNTKVIHGKPILRLEPPYFPSLSSEGVDKLNELLDGADTIVKISWEIGLMTRVA